MLTILMFFSVLSLYFTIVTLLHRIVIWTCSCRKLAGLFPSKLDFITHKCDCEFISICKSELQDVNSYLRNFFFYCEKLHLPFFYSVVWIRAETIPRITRIQKIIEANYVPRKIVLSILLGMHWIFGCRKCCATPPSSVLQVTLLVYFVFLFKK